MMNPMKQLCYPYRLVEDKTIQSGQALVYLDLQSCVNRPVLLKSYYC